MVYLLYRVPGPGTRDGQLLGEYACFDDALLARDEDVIVLLGEREGGRTLACHHIVGPGGQGPPTAHEVTSAVGRVSVPAGRRGARGDPGLASQDPGCRRGGWA